MDGSTPLPPGQHLVSAPKVRHYGPVPRVGARPWSMIFSVDQAGGGETLGRLTVAELAELEGAEVDGDLHCASGWSAQSLAWSGVPTAVLVDRFPPPPGTVGVLVYGEYGYSANVRLEDLLRPSSLVATGLDGRPLAPEHGFPVRLVVPHLYSWKSAKWFRGWEYLTAQRRGFWEERGYHLHGDPWAEERYSYLE